MARAYSDDLRDRVAAAVLSGRSVREVAGAFGVSVASAVKWSQRLRDTGNAGSRPMGGHKQRVLAGEQEWMLWPAAGLVDTEIGCFHLSEAHNATKEVQPRVQA
ncbi:transposase [Sphingobium lignivorans]|uniref:Transposase n=1 Tax=Sphingobium lignivorans TaxID=2735886 RepID=A0ABR6NCQ5_9SPHN|nr:transposase [Sphingobium lignivorans]